jgi:polyferredoxin
VVLLTGGRKMTSIKAERNLHKSRAKNIRTWIQVFFFALVALISVNKTLEASGIVIPLLSTASLHAICPFGGVVTLWQFFTTGTFIQKIHESSLVLMSAALLLGLFFGPVICGWICPLGSIQEWIGKIGKKLFKKRYNHIIPLKTDRFLRYTRYILLIMVVVNTAISGKLMFQDIDPYYALFSFWTGEVAIAAYIILSLTLALSLVVERPWCKYACPYGAFLGLTNLVRIFPVRRNESTCISCKACDKACPMNITVSAVKMVRNHQCISCMICTSESSCPVSDTVAIATKGGLKK